MNEKMPNNAAEAIKTAPEAIENEMGGQADAYIIKGTNLSVEKASAEAVKKAGVMDKIEGLFAKKELTSEGALNLISEHPAKSKVYDAWKAKDPAMAQKYVEFVRQNPKVKYAKEVNGEFVDATIYGLGSSHASDGVSHANY